MMTWLKQIRFRSKLTASSATQGIHVSLNELIQLQYPAQNLGLFTNKRVLSHQGSGYLSPFKGRGIDFEEVRTYQAGDDIRLMDWRVTARTGKPHTKVFHEERERPIYIVVNASHSMYFGTKVQFKLTMAAKAAALMAWAAVKQGDRVGGLIYNGAQCQELTPKSRKMGILPLLKALHESTVTRPPQIAQTGIEQALMKLRYTVKPGSFIVLLSDFMDLNDMAQTQLAWLAKYCEVMMGFIYDPIEKNPPPANHYGISDGQNITIIDTHNPHFCQHYQSQFELRLQNLIQFAHRYQISFLEMKTNDNLIHTLNKGLYKKGIDRMSAND